MSLKFGQIQSGTTELAALEHLKDRCCPFSHFTVVVTPGKKSGERLQDQWSSGFYNSLVYFHPKHFFPQVNFHGETIKLMGKEFHEWPPFYLDRDGP